MNNTILSGFGENIKWVWARPYFCILERKLKEKARKKTAAGRMAALMPTIAAATSGTPSATAAIQKTVFALSHKNKTRYNTP